MKEYLSWKYVSRIPQYKTQLELDKLENNAPDEKAKTSPYIVKHNDPVVEHSETDSK